MTHEADGRAEPVAPITETVIKLSIAKRHAHTLAEVADAARNAVGARLITISLWRPSSGDLVRVYSSSPRIYPVGGISSELGADWVQRCVVRMESFIAADENGIKSDAFEHQDVLEQLGLEAAINAVIVKDAHFLGCLNLLSGKGSYDQRSVGTTEHLAGGLVEALDGIGAASAG